MNNFMSVSNRAVFRWGEYLQVHSVFVCTYFFYIGCSRCCCTEFRFVIVNTSVSYAGSSGLDSLATVPGVVYDFPQSLQENTGTVL
jgi:hypothetical protein